MKYVSYLGQCPTLAPPAAGEGHLEAVAALFTVQLEKIQALPDPAILQLCREQTAVLRLLARDLEPVAFVAEGCRVRPFEPRPADIRGASDAGPSVETPPASERATGAGATDRVCGWQIILNREMFRDAYDNAMNHSEMLPATAIEFELFGPEKK